MKTHSKKAFGKPPRKGARAGVSIQKKAENKARGGRPRQAPEAKNTIDLDALPLDVRLEIQSILATHIQRMLEARGVTEEEILADFEASRKAGG